MSLSSGGFILAFSSVWPPANPFVSNVQIIYLLVSHVQLSSNWLRVNANVSLRDTRTVFSTWSTRPMLPHAASGMPSASNVSAALKDVAISAHTKTDSLMPSSTEEI